MVANLWLFPVDLMHSRWDWFVPFIGSGVVEMKPLIHTVLISVPVPRVNEGLTHLAGSLGEFNTQQHTFPGADNCLLPFTLVTGQASPTASNSVSSSTAVTLRHGALRTRKKIWDYHEERERPLCIS